MTDDLDALIEQLTAEHEIELRDAEHHSTIRRQPPLLAELADARAASTGLGRGTAKALHERLALNVDAADLHRAIEHRLRDWATQVGIRPSRLGWPPLDQLAAAWWARVQQVTPVDVRTYAAKLAEWAQAIDDLIDPPVRYSLTGACPACGSVYVETADRAGRALQVTARHHSNRSVVTCRACEHVWRGLDGARELAAKLAS